MPEIVELDNEPDDDEVLQVEDPEGNAVTVKVGGIARVQDLPRKAVSVRTVQVTATASVRLLVADHRRFSARIVAEGNPVLISPVPMAPGDPGFPLAVGAAPFSVGASTVLHVISRVGTATVSVFSEYWATGKE